MPGLGGRGMNPKKMNAMMRQLGISIEEIDDVQEVIIRTPTREIFFLDANVSIMKAQGQDTYQVTGTPQERAPGTGSGGGGATAAPAEEEVLFNEDDVKLVAEQANVSLDKAREALKEANGEPAEAIIKLVD